MARYFEHEKIPEDDEMMLQRFVAAAISAMITLLVLYGISEYGKSIIEHNMDILETHYYADGGFMMIDSNQGLIGVYEAAKPVRHIWQTNVRDLLPGFYNLCIHDGWLELYGGDLHAVLAIYTSPRNSRYFKEHVKQNIPVIVYGSVNTKILKN